MAATGIVQEKELLLFEARVLSVVRVVREVRVVRAVRAVRAVRVVRVVRAVRAVIAAAALLLDFIRASSIYNTIHDL